MNIKDKKLSVVCFFISICITVGGWVSTVGAETNINGIYYFRDDKPTHGPGYNTDMGLLSRTAPTSDELRWCDAWIQFSIDEDGTYTQTNQITNIYYHIWWKTNDNPGTLGYMKTGSYDAYMDESFTINTTDIPNKVGNYHLYAGKQIPSPTISIVGTAIYFFTAKLSGEYPIIFSSADKSSFIILNLAADTTLRMQDSDGEGLSDYDELFVYRTNPYDADTDHDGWSDKYEVDHGFNPIDHDSAPTFGKQQIIKQYNVNGCGIASISDIDGDGKEDVLIGAPGVNSSKGAAYIYSSTGSSAVSLRQYSYNGGAAGDMFGFLVASISDIDGDGKDDVLVGSGRVNDSTGAVYLYSSASSSTVPLRQYNGGAIGDNFGGSISSIADMDGDGKEDVLIGASGVNSSKGVAYIYSSGTGNLIRQYNGGAEGDNFGSAVSTISDIDGDGKDDILIAATNGDGTGSVYIYSSTGSSTVPLKQYNNGIVYSYFGCSISSISDIDGDGKDDVLVGAYNTTNGDIEAVGSAYIYSSGTGNLIRQYNGGTGDVLFGSSVASISDMDGDGKDDVLVGAPGTSSSGLLGAGAVYLYSSVTGNLIRQYKGATTGESLGGALSSISDIDGDGKDDVLIVAVSGIYIYPSLGNIPAQSWPKGASKNNSLDLDDYFTEENNLTIPARNQIVTYTASTLDNPIIDVSIDSDNNVSFSQPDWWAGTETVVFTATDSTGLSSTSNTVILAVIGEGEIGWEGEEDGGYCFIATVAYGTPMAEEVKVLSKFRDEYLLTNLIGEGFVNTYYKVSPKIASFIREHPVLRSIVRNTLSPIIWMNRKTAE